MIRKALSFFFIFSIPALLVASEPEPSNDMTASSGSVSGKVTDSETDRPVEYATIGVYSHADSSLVTGTISNSDGSFTIRDLPYGKYFVDITFVGYEHERIDQLVIGPDSRKVEVGPVLLDQATESIDAVEVVARQSTVEYKIDKKVINVGQDVASAGGTAVDVLENTASVQTDIDGNISLRGSSNFTVLIDGRPSILEGSDALQQIPTSSIQRIEIITNPSAKYDPDGTSGIINVIMKKERRTGFNGIVNASAESQGEYSLDAVLNYRTGKFNIFGSVETSERPSPGSGFMRNETLVNDTLFYFESDGEREWKRGGQVWKGGFDYFINDRNTLSLSGSVGDRRFGISSLNRYYEYSMPASGELFYIQSNRFEVDNNYYRADLNYRLTFDRPGQELTVYAYYSSNDGDDRQEIFEEITDASYRPLESEPGRQQSREISGRDQIRFNLDYVHPFSETKRLETGFQSQFNQGEASYLMESFDPDLQQWSPVDGFSNATDFHRNIHSVYAMYYGSFRNWFDYQVGLRGEYTDRMIRSLGTGEDYPIDRFDLYPSVFLSRKLPGDQQVQASYSRRVDRPRSWYLDPFPNYSDPRNIRIGNPGLKPEFIDSWELNYQKRFRQHVLSVETYYRKTYDKITSITELREDNVMVRTFENLNSDQALGLEMMANLLLTRWWDLMASSNIYHYKVTRLEQDGGGTRERNTFNLRANSNFRISKTGTRIQLTGLYNGPSVDAQGSSEAWWMTNIGVRQDFLENALSITLRVSDVFGTMKWASVTEGTNFTSQSEFSRQSPIFGISVSYKINNYKQRRGDSPGGDMDFGGEMGF